MVWTSRGLRTDAVAIADKIMIRKDCCCRELSVRTLGCLRAFGSVNSTRLSSWVYIVGGQMLTSNTAKKQ